MPRSRVDYTDEDDANLIKYLALFNPSGNSRNGNGIYEALVENADGDLEWANRHSWHSWRGRYVKFSEHFDHLVSKYQTKNKISPSGYDLTFVMRGKQLSDQRLDKTKALRLMRRKVKWVKGDLEGNGDEDDFEERSEDSNVEKVKRKRKRIAEESDGERKKVKQEKVTPVDVIEVQSGEDEDGRKSDKPKINASERDSHPQDELTKNGEGVEMRVKQESPAPSVSSETSEAVGIQSEEVDELLDDDDNGRGGSANVDQRVIDDQLAIPQSSEASNAPSAESLHLGIATSPPLHLVETPNPEEPVETSLLGTDDVSAHILPVPVVSEEALIQVSESEQSRISDTRDKSSIQQDPMPPLSEPEAHLSLTPPTSPRRTANVASVVRDASPQLASLASADAFGTSREIGLRQLVERQSKRTRSRSERSKEFDDSDYFKTEPGSPQSVGQSSIPSPRTARQLPRLIEGPFSSSFAGSIRRMGSGLARRESDENESEDDDIKSQHANILSDWPPRRGKIGPAQAVTRESISRSEDANVRSTQRETTNNAPPRLPKSTAVLAIPAPRSTAVVLDNLKERRQQNLFKQHQMTKTLLSKLSNHINSGKWSSRDSTESLHHPFSQSTPIPDPSTIIGGDGAFEDRGKGTSTRLSRNGARARRPHPPRNGVAAEAVSRLNPAPVPDRSHSDPVHAQNRQTHKPAAAAETLSVDSKAIPEERRDVSLDLPTTNLSSTSTSVDPFADVHNTSRRANSTKAFSKSSRRETFGGYSAAPFVNLAAMRHLPHRRSLSGQSKIMIDQMASPTLTAAARSSESLSAKDKKLAIDEGLKSLIYQMSLNHGFQEHVTWRLWDTLRDLQVVDLTLKGMRDVAEQFADDIVAIVDEQTETSGGGNSADGDNNTVHISGQSSSSRRSSRGHSPQNGASRKSLSRLIPISSSSGIIEPEYSPPQASRAGKFSRLARQGRVKEALKREGRRASHSGVTPHKGPHLQKLILAEKPQKATTSIAEFHGLIPEAALDSGSAGLEESIHNDDDSQIDVWGEEEDEMLRRGDAAMLEQLEKNMGQHSVKRRTVELLTAFGVL